ncbi:MAG: adenosylcobinamide-GDP ribazoletransferase [Clostridiales bacterium]|nr:adenosylcobinamide-GDP ribazoletransferase [Clostridiales bacterium]
MRQLLTGFKMSVSMFSVLPVRGNPWDDRASKFLIPFYPLVGVLIGLIWYALGRLFLWWKPPLMLSTGILMVIPAILSGFLHVDGFMDVCDAIGSRKSMEEKQRILKDSHVGAFAVIACLLWMFFSFVSMYTVLEAGKSVFCFLYIPVVSRCITGFCVMQGTPISKNSYLTIYQKDKKSWQLGVLFLYLLLLFGVLILRRNTTDILVFLSMLLVNTVLFFHATRQLGGMSGDISGYMVTAGELFALLFYAWM